MLRIQFDEIDLIPTITSIFLMQGQQKQTGMDLNLVCF